MPLLEKRSKKVVVMTMIMHNENDSAILNRLSDLDDPLVG